MELKRFILTSKGKIFDLKTQSIIGHGEKLPSNYRGYELKIGLDAETTSEGVIKKTSDNILDLVEVGDLIGIEVTPNAQITTSGYDGLEIRQLHLPITFHEKHALYNGGAVLKSEIKAIYKRQTNGDYKRYSVGGKE